MEGFTVDTVLDTAQQPSTQATKTRKNWESKQPEEQISGCRKVFYGGLVPILHALANNEAPPVQHLDEEQIASIEGLFEACFEGYEQLSTSKGRRVTSSS